MDKISDRALDLGIFALDRELEQRTGRAHRAVARPAQRLSLAVEFYQKTEQVAKWIADMRRLGGKRPRPLHRRQTMDRKGWSTA